MVAIAAMIHCSSYSFVTTVAIAIVVNFVFGGLVDYDTEVFCFHHHNLGFFDYSCFLYVAGVTRVAASLGLVMALVSFYRAKMLVMKTLHPSYPYVAS